MCSQRRSGRSRRMTSCDMSLQQQAIERAQYASGEHARKRARDEGNLEGKEEYLAQFRVKSGGHCHIWRKAANLGHTDLGRPASC